MTDGGDGEFEVHPGDPWSPGWTDDAAEQPQRRRPSVPEPEEKKRRWFGRKRRNEIPVADEFPTEEHVAYSEPTVRPETQFSRASGFERGAPEAVGPAAAGPAAAGVAEPPMPAWLSDPPRPAADLPLPVELPAWVGNATVGAEVVAAGFEDVPAVAPPQPPPPVAEAPMSPEALLESPAPVDRSEALPALGAPEALLESPAPVYLNEALAALGGDVSEVEVASEPVADEVVDPAAVSREAFEALRRLEGDEPATRDDPFEALRRLEAEAETEAAAGPPPAAADESAITGRYGVVGKEAFAALGDADAEDLTDWQAYAGAEAAAPVPRRDRSERRAPSPAEAPAAPEAEASDEWATEPIPRRKRGIWPFRRHRDEVEDEAVAEEATEWIDDGAAPAPGWFADVDEDELLPPTPDLPETEWPVPIEPAATAETAPTVVAPAPPLPVAPIAPPTSWAEPAAEPAPGGVAAGEQPPLDFEAGAAPLVETPPSRLPDLELVRPPLWEVPQFEDEAPSLEAGDLDAGEEAGDSGSIELPAPSSPYTEGDEYEMPRRPEPGYAPESLEEDLEDLRAGGPWRLDFDDGTSESPYGASAYDPAPAPAVRGDRDVWEEGPDWDPEATVEMTDPGLALSDDLYGRAGTIEHRGLAEEIFRLGAEDTEWQAMSAAMPGIETGVVGFEDVADLRTGEQYREAPRSDLGARVGTGLLLLVFLLGTMFVGGAAMAVFIGAMALLGIWEFYGTLRRLEFQPLTLLGYAGGIGLLAAVWFHGPVAIPVALSLLVVLVFFVYAFSPLRQDALANGGLTVLAVAWVAGTVAFATPILRQEDFRILVMAVVAATVAMDVGAFSFGRTWGSRALAPLVSPNKSIEGLLGGILLTIGAGVAIGLFAEPFDLRTGIALGIVVSVMAPLGDLAESMVKRSLGVKDMGTILPGHGGVLDRIDGFLFVLPPAWLLYLVTGLLG